MGLEANLNLIFKHYNYFLVLYFAIGPLREDVGTGIKHPVGVTHILAGKLEKSLGKAMTDALSFA